MNPIAKRTDNNHRAVIEQFKRQGWGVIDTHELGKGFPDIIVYDPRMWGFTKRYYVMHLIEIKNGNAKYTADEIKFMEKHPIVETVRCLEDVIAYGEVK